MKSCFMFGHADTPDDILPILERTVEELYIKYKIQLFYVGNRGNFDRLAALAAKRVKQRYPDLQLFLLLAYHPSDRTIDLTYGFDGSYYPPLESVPKRYAIIKANNYMAGRVDAIICYVNHFGNTRNLLERVMRRKLREEIIVVNLSE